MAETTKHTPKARSTLTIRYVQRSEDSRLLKLPRELRDAIYEFALIEPRLWDKRHNVVCAFYDPDKAWEPRPCGLDLGSVSFHNAELPRADLKLCHELCVRRKGVNLLLVNRQIHDEASPILFANNTFCFDTAKDFVDTFDKDDSFDAGPHSILPMISKISLVAALNSERYNKKVFEILASMVSLADLEISSHEFRNYGPALRALPQLNVLRSTCVIFKHTDFDARRAWFPVALTKSFIMPKCQNKAHLAENEPRNRERLCPECVAFSEDMDLISSLMIEDIFNPQGGALHRKIEHKLKWLSAAQQSHEPHAFDARLSNGAKCEAKIWSLPVDSIEVREKRRRKARAVGRFEGKTWSRGSVPVKVIDEEDEEYPSGFSGRSAKNYQRQLELAEADREVKDNERHEMREKERKHEAAREKSSVKKAIKARVREDNKRRAEQQAARKRLGR